MRFDTQRPNRLIQPLLLPGRPLGLCAGNIPRIGLLPVVNQRGLPYRAAEDSDLCIDLGPSLFSYSGSDRKLGSWPTKGFEQK